MIHELVIAFLLGLIGGVIPGPVLTTVFTEILQSGFARSLRIILLALLVETVVAVISLLFLETMGLNETFFRLLSLAGAGVLIWIALSVWKVKSLDQGDRVQFGPGKITLMILTNGVLWTYWLTICIPKAILLNDRLSMGAYIFMGLVQAGWLISTTAVALIFSRFRKLMSKPRVIPVLFKLFSVAFIYFALDMVYKSVDFFLNRG